MPLPRASQSVTKLVSVGLLQWDNATKIPMKSWQLSPERKDGKDSNGTPRKGFVREGQVASAMYEVQCKRHNVFTYFDERRVAGTSISLTRA